MLRSRLYVFLSLLLVGFVILPVLAFIVGHYLAGSYEGRFGVFGYLGAIYADFLRGKWAASVLVATPLVVIGFWYGALRLRAYLLRKSQIASE